MLTIGSPAPAFTLPDQDGKAVALKDLRGRWVVLYFYPKDDTPGCTVEACEFTAALPAFHGLDAEVFGCSADGAAAHTKFVAKYKLGIRLLTDADRSVMKTYGAFGSKLMYGKKVEGVIRSTVLIAPDGTVAHHWATVKAAGHAEQVRSKLAELQGGGAAAAAPAKAAKKPAAKKPAAKSVKAAAKKPVAAKKPAKPAKKAAKKAKAAKK
ncbi:MAG: peroxiredoxin [Planctomycetota bacterium]|jgi:peroxiredoxin Q/BCP